MSKRLTKQEILKIVALKKEGKTNAEIAVSFGVARSTIEYWIPKLRQAGHKIANAKKGVPAIDLGK